MFQLTSSAYEDGQKMPVKYANTGVPGGENISVPLAWSNPPEGTKSYAIAMVDRHPIAGNWVHWLVINISSDVSSLSEGASGLQMPKGAKELMNTFGSLGYGGPQPPPGSGDHEYETTIYALKVEMINLGSSVELVDFERAISGQVLDSAKLTGKFGR